jgi:hypothetical protein
VDSCGNLDFGARISVYRQWSAKLKQLIGMIGEAYYNSVAKIRLHSAERAGDGGQKLFGTVIFTTFLISVVGKFPKGAREQDLREELFTL